MPVSSQVPVTYVRILERTCYRYYRNCLIDKCFFIRWLYVIPGFRIASLPNQLDTESTSWDWDQPWRMCLRRGRGSLRHTGVIKLFPLELLNLWNEYNFSLREFTQSNIWTNTRPKSTLQESVQGTDVWLSPFKLRRFLIYSTCVFVPN